jgi:predicted peptidase
MKPTNLIAASMAMVCTLICTLTQGASPSAGKQVEQSFTSKDGAEVGYLLYLPEDYDAKKENLPIMLFLHGRGESDGPLSLVAKWGPPEMLSRGEKLPFIVVSPQCPKDDSWSSTTQQARLNELLDSVIEKYHADKDRVYLAGLSMGGSGSWRMAAGAPERFAAVIPICGRGEPADAAKLKDLPIWVFVGDQDRVFQSNVDMVDALRKAGSQTARLTTLEHIGHNSWSAAFASPDLFTWLQKQTRAKS